MNNFVILHSGIVRFIIFAGRSGPLPPCACVRTGAKLIPSELIKILLK
jgi:hypothetical protein